jgi:hypothetical protein
MSADMPKACPEGQGCVAAAAALISYVTFGSTAPQRGFIPIYSQLKLRTTPLSSRSYQFSTLLSLSDTVLGP